MDSRGHGRTTRDARPYGYDLMADDVVALMDVLSHGRPLMGATNIKKIADAAKPLYDALDESQKHKFGMLGRMLMPERPRFAMDMMRHHMGEHDRDGAEQSRGDLRARGEKKTRPPRPRLPFLGPPRIAPTGQLKPDLQRRVR